MIWLTKKVNLPSSAILLSSFIFLLVDPVSFRYWSEEAFALWSKQWGNLYDPESKSRKVIEKIASSYYLVNLVDNDFARGNCLWNLIEDAIDRTKLNAILNKKPNLLSVAQNTPGIQLVKDEDHDH